LTSKLERHPLAALKQYDDAFNKQDAVAIAALFTVDAIEEMGWQSEGGAVAGQPAIEKGMRSNSRGV
jgi:hypothetical protein